MNVLHINQSDISGGAAIAAYRLHQRFLTEGINSRLLVGRAATKNEYVAEIPRKPCLEKQIYRLSSRLSLNYLHYVGALTIPEHDFYQEADILNLHNLHSGTFNYLAIPKINRSKPIVFTLHDMWAFTGHCAYSYDCCRWKSGCRQCPYPDSYPAITKDVSGLEWKLKNWVYSKANLVIVTPSSWLAEYAKRSILHRFPIHHIPNGIDIKVYRPLDREQCRSLLGIPLGKRVLLFGAESLRDPRKGGNLLLKALQCLPASLKEELILLNLGENSEQASIDGISTLNLGYVSNDRLKTIIYSAADLFIFPTRADNLPLMLQESMACGTPMVSFKVGGVPELVRPGITGYLAHPEDSDDFRNGIIQLLEDHTLYQQMKSNCRQIALTEYSLDIQAQRYISLYQQVLN